MKKLFSKNNLIKTIFVVLIICYVVITLISQQKKLNSYANTKKYYTAKIDEQKNRKKALIKTQENLNSDEYIEKIAREKLDMYYPNEKVYVDASK